MGQVLGQGIVNGLWLGLLALVAAMALLLAAASRALAERFGQNYVTACRVRLLTAIVRTGDRGSAHGLAMTRLVTDLSTIKNWLSLGIAGGLTSFAMLIGLLIGAGFVAFEIALAMIISLMVSTLVGLAVASPLASAIKVGRSIRGGLAARLGDAVLNARSMRSHGLLPGEKRRTVKTSERLSKAMQRRFGWATLLRQAPEAGFAAGLASLLLIAPAPAPDQLAIAVMLLATSSLAMRGLSQTADLWLNYREGRRRLIKAFAVAGRRAELWPETGALTLQVQGFRGDKPDRRFSATIEAGEKVAMPAGAFTNAFIDAAAGLKRPYRGRILLGNQQHSQRDAMRVCGAVLLVDSRFNLRRGRIGTTLKQSGLSREVVNQALAVCGLDRSLLDQVLPETGEGLAPSIAARLRLARAFMGKPGVLIINDPIFELDGPARRALHAVSQKTEGTLILVTYGHNPAIAVDRWLEGAAELVEQCFE